MAELPSTHINRLPAEVLSLIFTTMVNASLYGRFVGDKTFGMVEHPTLLASVCTHWRSVALDIPGLWSFVGFASKPDDADGSDSLNNLNNLEHAKLYFKRSQDRLLHIQIGKPYPPDKALHKPRRQWSSELGHLLAASAPRVQSLALSFSDTEDVDPMLSALLTHEEGQSLQKLGLRFEPTTFGRQRRSSVLKLDYGPVFETLDTLHLHNLPVNPWFLSCRNLVELHITALPAALPPGSAAHIGHILENNPNLCTFKLSASSAIRGSPVSSQPIHLPALRHLHLGKIHGLLMNWLLVSLVLGSQEIDVFLECEGFQKMEQLGLEDTIISFFQRTRIKSLHIVGKWILLPPILAHTPRLQGLRLTLYDFDEHILDGIEQLGSTLTNLHTIEMDECHVVNDTALDPGLKHLLTLPSVLRVRHHACGGISRKARKNFRQLLEDQGITARILEAPNLSLEVCPSLLLYPLASC